MYVTRSWGEAKVMCLKAMNKFRIIMFIVEPITIYKSEEVTITLTPLHFGMILQKYYKNDC